MIDNNCSALAPVNMLQHVFLFSCRVFNRQRRSSSAAASQSGSDHSAAPTRFGFLSTCFSMFPFLAAAFSTGSVATSSNAANQSDAVLGPLLGPVPSPVANAIRASINLPIVLQP
jgi:hypothetical protein